MKKSLLPAVVTFWLALTVPLAWAGSLVISQGAGFSDNTVVAPVGGNSGTTLGQQRSNVFNAAAQHWSSIVQPSLNITISAQFSTLFCDASGYIIASGGSTGSDKDFAGAPYASTWYPRALRNHLAPGSAIAGAAITITANSKIGTDPACMTGASWYYGLDHNPGINQVDLLQIVKHEIGHGLGFITLVDLGSGAKSGGFDDVFMKFLRDHSLNKWWPVMSNAERVSSAIDSGDLVWTGSNVQHVKSALTSGFKSGTNYPLLYAPTTLINGTSVSHWNTNVTYSGAKHELMEHLPNEPFDMALTVALLRDIGWSTATYDFDGDSVADHLDAWPHKNAAAADTDGDGKADAWLAGSGCSGNTCSSLTLDWDDDNDGVVDTVDAAPLDAGNVTESNLPLDGTYSGMRYHSNRTQ